MAAKTAFITGITGQDKSIAALAQEISNCVGFEGDLVFDSSKPDGTMRKLMDSSKIRQAGWSPKTGLTEGLALAYKWYLEHEGAGQVKAA